MRHGNTHECPKPDPHEHATNNNMANPMSISGDVLPPYGKYERVGGGALATIEVDRSSPEVLPSCWYVEIDN